MRALFEGHNYSQNSFAFILHFTTDKYLYANGGKLNSFANDMIRAPESETIRFKNITFQSITVYVSCWKMNFSAQKVMNCRCKYTLNII